MMNTSTVAAARAVYLSTATTTTIHSGKPSRTGGGSGPSGSLQQQPLNILVPESHKIIMHSKHQQLSSAFYNTSAAFRGDDLASINAINTSTGLPPSLSPSPAAKHERPQSTSKRPATAPQPITHTAANTRIIESRSSFSTIIGTPITARPKTPAAPTLGAKSKLSSSVDSTPRSSKVREASSNATPDLNASSPPTTATKGSALKYIPDSTLPASGNHVEKKRDIIIHVFDENRNEAQRDFFCKQYLLVREMKYFGDFVTDQDKMNVEIDVHCDIEVFEWLMAYITRLRPGLEPRTAISILISSNFLQMEMLEDICLNYVHDHINEIVKVPIDMSCINRTLLAKLSKRFSIEELEEIVDPKDKLKNKLFMHKVSEILSNPAESGIKPAMRTPLPLAFQVIPPTPIPTPTSTTSRAQTPTTSQETPTVTSSSTSSPTSPPLTLRQCKWCGQIYLSDVESILTCEISRGDMDWHGELIARHEPDTGFTVNEWVAEMVSSGSATWREVLWRCWGYLHVAKCGCCGEWFTMVNLGRCRRHSLALQLVDGQRGKYPCCGEWDYAFNPWRLSKGCMMVKHQLDEDFKLSYAFTLYLRFQDVAAEYRDRTNDEAMAKYRPKSLADQVENGVNCLRIFGKWTDMQAGSFRDACIHILDNWTFWYHAGNGTMASKKDTTIPPT